MKHQRALIVDDHPFVLSGIASVLQSIVDCEIYEANDAEEGYRTYVEHKPTLLISDLSLPGASGLDLIRRVRGRDSNIKIVALSMYSDPQTVNRAIEAGANGFVAKTSAANCLKQALQRIHSDRVYIDPETSMNYAAAATKPSQGSALESLTSREYQIFLAFARGQTPRDIAQTYHISVNTVGNHKRNIFRKLGVKSTTQLALIAVSSGVAESSGSAD